MPTPNGPTGREAIRMIPLLRKDPLAFLTGLARTYGDVFRMPLPKGNQVMVVSRPDLAAQVLVSHQDNYLKARTYKPLTELLGNGLLTNEGESWARQRRIVQPMFARRHLDAFAPAMVAATSGRIDGWSARPAGTVVDMSAEMSALTLEIVGRALFSADLTGEAAAMAPALEAVLEAFERVVRHPLFLVVPNYHRWPTPNRLRSRASERHLTGVVDELITARHTHRDHDGPPDLLDMLLEARDAETGMPMPEQQVRDELMTFMLAGHETTANALAWTFMLLSQHPDARQRLESEVDGVLSGRPPTAEDVPKLEWTSAVISESMRLYPPAWMFEREAKADDDLGGIPVPAGSIVATPPYLIHRNPDHWPNPEGFDPARFAGDAAKSRHRFAYLPFGGGRRQCVGSGFALLEAVLVLATIAQRMRFDLALGFRAEPHPTVTLRPANGMLMAVAAR